VLAGGGIVNVNINMDGGGSIGNACAKGYEDAAEHK